MTLINPETACSLSLTQKNPAIKFSCKALTNGKDAAGAKWVRPAFSWNEQMDLAWALGFPWHAELFGRCWAEHDLGNLSEEQIQMMRDLYDEIVVG